MKYLTDGLNSDETIELTEWISSSPKNKKLFEKITNGELINILDELDKIDVKHEWESFETRHSIKNYKTRRQFNFYFTAASFFILACVIIIELNQPKNFIKQTPNLSIYNIDPSDSSKVILTLADGSSVDVDSAYKPIVQNNAIIKRTGNEIEYSVLPNYNQRENEFNTVTTQKGKIFMVVLPDGSKVWLNASSSIVFPTSFPEKDRKIRITGEAYFEIKHDSSKPFRVSITPHDGNNEKLSIEVLGTRFNVNAYQTETTIKTTLLEGNVKFIKGRTCYKIKPGQQLEISSTGKMAINNISNADEAIAWKNGLFDFNNAPIETVMRDISRWYGVTIVYDDYVSNNLTITVPRDIPLNNLLELLEMNSSVHFRILGKKIFISK